MKLYKYTSMAVSGTMDPYIVHGNLSKHYDDISYYNPFNNNYVGKKGDPAFCLNNRSHLDKKIKFVCCFAWKQIT